jgi:hypothetical protein
MATDQFEDDIELDEDIDEEDDLDLNVLDEDEDVEFTDDEEFDAAPADVVAVEEEEEEEEAPEAVEPAEDEDDDDVVVDEDEEEEDEETLEVLLGPDSEPTVTSSRSRKDDSGDAPPGEGEFTCRSCFLVKRRAQLADADAMICLDCA